VLDEYDTKHEVEPGRNIHFDLFLRYYFLEEKANINSLDREAIVEYAYALMRQKGFLNAICKKPVSWDSRFKAFLSPDFFE
jgi:hypothetical protein